MSDIKKLEIGTFICQNENVNGTSVQSFLGIPYAISKRFGMPKMIDSYQSEPANSGVGMRFPQNTIPPLINFFLKNPMMRKEILTKNDITDENAFVLNVWTSATEDKKPVLVFIHGGGFTYGSGTTPLYNGKYLAAQGIVVVTINYRLSAPGFIPVVIDGEISVNRGFIDQQCALKWVRKNISAFGGDAKNITLMGQSAGGMSVSMHMMSEESSKQFDKLIVCSGGANEAMSLETAEKLAHSFLKLNKLSGPEKLFSLSWKKLIRLKMPLYLLATPVVDGKFLKDDPKTLRKEGRYSPKPVMIGTTEDEFKMVDNKSWYKALGIVRKEAGFSESCIKSYGLDGLKLAKELRKTNPGLTQMQFKMMEMPFHVTALQEIKDFSTKAPCYGYRMNFIPNIWNGLRGAYHCAELPFIFGTIRDIVKPITEENKLQMNIMQGDWIAFIKDGVIPKREHFGVGEKITLYEGLDGRMVEFPQREIIEELQGTGLFSKIMLSFMRSRDDKFIA